ncbi:DUF4150 domain-containing protein [Morganella psychrotolerans]|uniref:DUF4150 domain-containing protein n=1 Tax=Morganella psychrotolerans TaxID=368603 RepID=A0A5M9R6M4_9GAMM|nr:PAAR-like domain-containing protein [Morganella psychrotolerans]KAA8716330.1 DUF4150 domain-containing protein [Morganella psychrotolerans]OBU02319.1 type VI secretion protein [Morganella psychrotolerans]
MTAANTRAGGIAFAGCEPMIPVPGPNTAPNATGVPNVFNYFCCGGNEQNLMSVRVSTISAGIVIGATGTNSAQMNPVQGSGKYFIQGSPATRLGDMSMSNNCNTAATQIAPSQTKYFINA